MSTTTDIGDGLAFLRDAPRLQRRGARWRTQTLELHLRLAELIGFFLAAIIAAACVSASFGEIGPLPALIAACCATAAAIESGRPRREIRPRPTALLLQVLAASATGTTVLVLTGTPWRTAFGWGMGELIGAAVLMAAIHALYSIGTETLFARGRLATHVALLGTGPTAQRLQAQLKSADPFALKLVGCYAASDEPAQEGWTRGSLRTLLSDCRLELVDAVVLAPEPGEGDTLPALRRSLGACTQDIYLVPGLSPDLDEPSAVKAELGAAELLLLSRCPIAGGAAFAKRAFDVVGALALIAFMAPLLGALALAITIDSRGPILFRQLRVGYNNRLFYIFKFRSMRHDAADRLAKEQTTRGDKRVTRVGRIIRRLSLDELPQLLNVLRGEMSLVGPRPHAPGTSVSGQRVHTVVDDYACRHLVRPGITGLAQVRGLRGGLQDRRQVADRLAADLEYIRRWSIWLDVRILMGTVVLELQKRRGC